MDAAGVRYGSQPRQGIFAELVGHLAERGEDDQCEYAVVKFEDGTTAQLEHAKLKQRVVAVSLHSACFIGKLMTGIGEPC